MHESGWAALFAEEFMVFSRSKDGPSHLLPPGGPEDGPSNRRLGGRAGEVGGLVVPVVPMATHTWK